MALKRVWLILKVEGTDKLLILKRSKSSNNPKQWDFIGGSSQGKIKPRKLIRKESLEEIGFIPRMSLLSTFYKKGSVYHYYIGVIKKTELINIQLNYEHSKFDTLELHKLRKKRKLHHSVKFYLSNVNN
jgi:hypothetical protein